MAGPGLPGSPCFLLPGEAQWSHLLQTGELQEGITEQVISQVHDKVGPINTNTVQMGKLRPDDRSRSHSQSGTM